VGDGGPPPWLCLDSRYRIGGFTGIHGATPNLEELEAHCGRRLTTDDEVAEGAELLRRDLGARFLLATRGNHGMTLVEDTMDPLHIPVFGTDEVADVTGAGDTVLAVLTAALAAGAEPSSAAALANIAAGLVVMKLGTATVTADELRTAVGKP
jgi:rfaE bifunctional protein kinase chain/domain